MKSLCFEWGQSSPDALALICGSQHWSYGQLQSAVEQRCQQLTAAGISQNAVVGLLVGDAPAHLIVSMALLQLGVTQVGIQVTEPMWAQQQLLQTCHVTALITDQQTTLGAAALLRIRCNRAQCEVEYQPAQTLQAPADLCGQALLVMGSGTTGAPKLIPIHFALLQQLIIRDNATRAMSRGDKHYSVSHVCYFTAKRRSWACLMRGVTVVLADVAAPRWVAFCREFEVQHLSLATHQAAQLLQQEAAFDEPVPRLPQLKSLFVSSSPVSDDVRDALERVISLHSCVAYGCNEFGEATCAVPGAHHAHAGTVGKPCPGVRIGVVDEAGQELAQGQIGQVYLEADEVLQGYFQNPTASDKHFKGSRFFPGDLGRVDDDGHLIFLGRVDDLMIVQGVNVYPRDLEQVLEAHPCVQEAAAFPWVDAHSLHIPVAVVRATTQVSEIDLLVWCEQHLGWKRPARIWFADALPKNASGKVLKRELAQQVSNLLKQGQGSAA